MRNTSGDQAAVYVGCAGWMIPKSAQDDFPAAGSHLVRYATRFSAAEINSSFYKRHRASTYARWAESVPRAFRFAVKVPKSITHVARLEGAEEDLMTFLADVSALGDRLGPLLFQLPPSLKFEAAKKTAAFFTAFRQQFAGSIVCEPRHPSWFNNQAGELLARFEVARVAADPTVVPAAGEPGGWQGLVYYRLHGSPRSYYSNYSDKFLAAQSQKLHTTAAAGSQAWCIFDNTAAGAAVPNALALIALLTSH